jgi:aspartate/methionine/tyrosine aminotransferase
MTSSWGAAPGRLRAAGGPVAGALAEPADGSGVAGPRVAGPEQGYPMRRWVFEDSLGRYDIDLGDSHVQCGRLGQLALPADLELGYGVDRGGAELRGLIAGMYGRPADSVVVTHGSQEAAYLLYQTLLRPGDQVVTFRPGWQQSWVVPELLGCRVDVLELDAELAVDPAAVAAVARPDLRLIVVATPNNPTGRLVGASELAQLLDLAERAGGYLLLDEEYGLDLATSAATRSSRAVSVSSLSKVYGLPGLRVGWLCGPPAVAAACAERKHLTSIANSVLCEALAVDVLTRREWYLAEYRRLVGGGLPLLRAWAARNAAAVQLVPPEGTPFAWLRLRTGEPALSFCRRVLDAGVLVMPAETVGARDGFRLSFAREPDVLAAGLARIEAVLRATPTSQRPPTGRGHQNRQATKTTTERRNLP